MKTIYGIRHHGPGCARSLAKALSIQQPDVILLEAPQEAESLIPQASVEGLAPPVAMLFYRVDSPSVSSFYPFAEFSPEWQAIQWAGKHSIPIRCFDLPATHRFGFREQAASEDAPEPSAEPDESILREDPFNWFAKADGYTDGERWWNDKIEERGDCQAFFEAILEAVSELRNELEFTESPDTHRREAWMRRCLRQAEKDGFENIAIVCGAWHAPALVDLPTVKADNELLKGMPKAKIDSTWAPWTHQRLTFASGYGAGVRSPGWYHHLWKNQSNPTARWLTRAARILRKHDLEGSSASIIEATRLADSLAGIRGRPRAGLDETLEAITSVFGAGDETSLALLNEKLIIGRKLGTLPDGISTLPLQKDIDATIKKLRLKPEAGAQELVLDLRENGGRNRSIFLHRLLALKIDWGKKTSAKTKGTFKEVWKLQWSPELTLAIIDASQFGGTVESAAATKLVHLEENPALDDLTAKLDLALLSDLPEAVASLLHQIDNAAAGSHESRELLRAVPDLVRMARYGDVRDTDTTAIERILGHLALRAHIEMTALCTGLDDDSAADVAKLVQRYHASITTLENAELLADLHAALHRVVGHDSVHPQPRGLAVRLLRDAGELDDDQVGDLLAASLSQGNPPTDAAAWLEGFLAETGSLLVHDRGLLALIDEWLGGIPSDAFQDALPVLRRTFGAFTSPERSNISSAVEAGNLSKPRESTIDADLDIAQAIPALRTVADLLGLPTNTITE